MFSTKIIKQRFAKAPKPLIFNITNENLQKICRTTDVISFIKPPQKKYLAHIISRTNRLIIKYVTSDKQ